MIQFPSRLVWQPFALLMVRFSKQNFTGTKLMASVRKKSNSRSRTSPKARSNGHLAHPKRLVVCVRNERYKASLELRKLYEVLDDAFGEKHKLVRMIDESGEDYLYPSDYFVRIPASLQQKLRKIA